MGNNKLMEILFQLNRSNRNKNLAWVFGGVAILGVATAIYMYKKNKAITNDSLIFKEQIQSLLGINNNHRNEINRKNKIIESQSQVIKNFVDNDSASEKKDNQKS